MIPSKKAKNKPIVWFAEVSFLENKLYYIIINNIYWSYKGRGKSRREKERDREEYVDDV